MKNNIFKPKPTEELESLSTKNLLAYYKAERQRLFKFIARHTCDCGCGETSWDLNSRSENAGALKKEYDNRSAYVKSIKILLNKREHVTKK